MDSDRFTKKRHSLVGGGLAKFESAEAADEFARRQSAMRTRVRQSIPDIRFDENGMPISTRQLQARSLSLAGGSLNVTGGRYGGDGAGDIGGVGTRRASDLYPSGAERNVRKLSKKFSSTEEEDLKTNFTIPENSRAGMFGTNRRWNVKPDWMKKRRSSVKEEFIEKNLSNLESLATPSPPMSPTTPEEEMTSISEELTLSGGEEVESNDDTSSESGISSSDEDCSDCDQDPSETEITDEEGITKRGTSAERHSSIGQDKDIDTVLNGSEENGGHQENGDSSAARKRVNSTRQKRKSKKANRKERGVSNGDMPPRPPPPPLPVEMCDPAEFTAEEPGSSGSAPEDEPDGVEGSVLLRTQYGKQRLYVSCCQHVFQPMNGPSTNGIDGLNTIGRKLVVLNS